MKDRVVIFKILSFLLPFIVYFMTLSPTVSFTDSGELAAVCSTLGIAHPTGYPLFTLLGYIWLQLPLPFSDVHSLNIFVAVLTAFSSFFVFNTLFLLISKFELKAKQTLTNNYYKEIITLAGSLTYSFALTVWQQALSVEVYSLHLLMLNIIIYYAIQGYYSKEFQNKYFIIASVFLGLSFSNHLTTILIVPALIYLFFSNGKYGLSFSSEKMKFFGIMALFTLAGLTVYAYLPLRSMGNAEFNWGMVHRSLDKFLYHIQGKQYQVWMFSGEQVGENIARFFTAIPYQLAFIGIPFILNGMWRILKESKPITIFIIIFVISCYFYSINYSIHDIETYFLTAYLGFIILAIIGIYDLFSKFPKFVYLAFIMPALSIGINFSTNDNSKNYLVEDFTKNMVNNLDKDAVIISSQWDYWNSAFWYYQKVEHLRKDVVLIEKELLRRTWYPYQLRKWYPEVINKSKSDIDNYMIDLEKFETGADPEDYKFIQAKWETMLKNFVENNIDSRPVYITLDIMNSEPYLTKNYNLVPEGFAFRLYRDNSIKQLTINGLKLDRFIKSIPSDRNHLEQGIMETASINIANIGRYAQFNKDFKTANEAYTLAIKINPENQIASQGLFEINK